MSIFVSMVVENWYKLKLTEIMHGDIYGKAVGENSA